MIPRARAAADRLSKHLVPSDPQLYEAIAAAQAASGDFPDAAEQQQRALDQASRLHWGNPDAMQERLAAYRASKPWIGNIFASPATEGASANTPTGR